MTRMTAKQKACDHKHPTHPNTKSNFREVSRRDLGGGVASVLETCRTCGWLTEQEEWTPPNFAVLGSR